MEAGRSAVIFRRHRVRPAVFRRTGAKIFPAAALVVVTENLKTQESFQQDLETWSLRLQVAG